MTGGGDLEIDLETRGECVDSVGGVSGLAILDLGFGVEGLRVAVVAKVEPRGGSAKAGELELSVPELIEGVSELMNDSLGSVVGEDEGMRAREGGGGVAATVGVNPEGEVPRRSRRQIDADATTANAHRLIRLESGSVTEIVTEIVRGERTEVELANDGEPCCASGIGLKDGGHEADNTKKT